MIDFNKPVQTKSGKSVEIIYSKERKNTEYNIIGWVENDIDISTWTFKGEYIANEDLGKDLMNIPEKPVIDFNKPVKQIDGKSVRILCTDAKTENYPVLGLTTENGMEFVNSWTKKGKFSICEEYSSSDLVNYEDENDKIPEDYLIWKQKVLKLGIVKPKEWFHEAYGRYCSNVRSGRWSKDKLISANIYNED